MEKLRVSTLNTNIKSRATLEAAKVTFGANLDASKVTVGAALEAAKVLSGALEVAHISFKENKFVAFAT